MRPNNGNALVPTTRGELVRASGVDELLARIRPTWQARDLINRVQNILPIDPSSACQRLFNATIHDLREKIIVAGLDIAKVAAVDNKLPPVTKNEDIMDNYSATHILELAYRMGLLNRPEWKRLRRAYDIRRDLEHEDDEYDADIADCVYMFTACVEIVLSQDPVQVLRVTDVKQFVEAPGKVSPSSEFLIDFERAPDPRQREILEFLVSTALDTTKPDIVRQNSFEALRSLSALSHNTVRIELAKSIQERLGRRPLDTLHAKVATASGVLPYLRQPIVEAFFAEMHLRLNNIGYGWRNHSQHGDILDELEDVGGLTMIPDNPRQKIVLWLVLCYLGEPGEYGWYGRNRKVFFSDAAARRIERLIKAAGSNIKPDLELAKEDRRVIAAIRDVNIARRLERLIDLTDLS